MKNRDQEGKSTLVIPRLRRSVDSSPVSRAETLAHINGFLGVMFKGGRTGSVRLGTQRICVGASGEARRFPSRSSYGRMPF